MKEIKFKVKNNTNKRLVFISSIAMRYDVSALIDYDDEKDEYTPISLKRVYKIIDFKPRIDTTLKISITGNEEKQAYDTILQRVKLDKDIELVK